MRDEREAYHVGQMNAPSMAEFRDAFEEIFARHYFTNHGPLEKQLDEALAEYFGVRHAVSVVNGATALMLLLKALDIRGDVILPAFTFAATAQAISWAGLRPVFCDVDAATHMLTADAVAKLMGPDTAAILGVHVWGRGCAPVDLATVAARHDVRLLFDAAHAMGCSFQGCRIGGFGDAEMFSFHATKVLNGLEGGCITTNDRELARRLRVMRSFHDGDAGVAQFRLNAKLSEAQAAMALMGLRGLDSAIEANRLRYEAYRRGLADTRGIRFIDHAEGEASNFQYVVISIDTGMCGMTRDALHDALREQGILARRYFHPGLHRTPPFNTRPWDLPVTDALCASLLQLPSSQVMDEEDVAMICSAIREFAGA